MVKSAAAASGLLSLLSVNPWASFGLVPWKASLSVILFVLKFAGALGTALRAIVKLSASVCAVISGVPVEVRLSVLLPALSPV